MAGKRRERTTCSAQQARRRCTANPPFWVEVGTTTAAGDIRHAHGELTTSGDELWASACSQNAGIWQCAAHRGDMHGHAGHVTGGCGKLTGGATMLRLCCTKACGRGEPCHGWEAPSSRPVDASGAGDRDGEETIKGRVGTRRKGQRWVWARGAAVHRPRSDQGKWCGPRAATADRASRTGYVSLLRF